MKPSASIKQNTVFPAPETWGCLVSSPRQAAEARELGAAWMVASHAGALSKGPAAVVGLLPFADANAMVLDMGREVVKAAETVPVLAGILAVDQFRQTETLLRMVARVGYAGIQTFPSVGILGGGVRSLVKSAGLDRPEEMTAIALAAKMGLYTAGVAFSGDEVGEVLDAGADLVVVHLPLLSGGGPGEWDADNRLVLIRAKSECAGHAAVAAFVSDTGRPAGMTLTDTGVCIQYETVESARLNKSLGE